MDEPRIDLESLDPFADVRYREAVVASVMYRAREELARRREKAPLWGVLAQWARPVLAAAAVAALISLVTLERTASASDVAQTGVIEELGLPDRVAQLLIVDGNPDEADIVLASWEDQ